MISAKWLDYGRSTIFLLPLVAMHIQYRHAAQSFQLIAESWNNNTSSLAPALVILATIDYATHEQFKAYVRVLVQKKLLARIVIDEAHLILTHADFRPVMNVLQWLASIPVPIVIMTATLPPTLEKSLLNKIGITTARVVRAPTSRPNISFRVIHAEHKLEDSVKEQFAHAMAYGQHNRVLVFCLSVNQAIHYGRLLGIPSCYSGLGHEELSDILHDFRNKPSMRALATTSILGVGLDIPSVTHTIHVDFP
jgi:superfamily II DNA helicase RecQ